MMIGSVVIDDKKYKLQHPGAYSYYGKQKELQLIDGRGYIQWDTQKLFDYCFGQDGQGGQVVFPENHTKIKWREAGMLEPGENDGQLIPTLSELRGIWAIILPSFLDGEFLNPPEDDKNKWKWVDTAGGNPKSTGKKVSKKPDTKPAPG